MSLWNSTNHLELWGFQSHRNNMYFLVQGIEDRFSLMSWMASTLLYVGLVSCWKWRVNIWSGHDDRNTIFFTCHTWRRHLIMVIFCIIIRKALISRSTIWVFIVFTNVLFGTSNFASGKNGCFDEDAKLIECLCWTLSFYKSMCLVQHSIWMGSNNYSIGERLSLCVWILIFHLYVIYYPLILFWVLMFLETHWYEVMFQMSIRLSLFTVVGFWVFIAEASDICWAWQGCSWAVCWVRYHWIKPCSKF